MLQSPMDFFIGHVGISVTNMDFETYCWSATDCEGILWTHWELN
jgi:hypothetical protein